MHGVKDDVVLNLIKMLVDKGLIDEAAKQLHDAGLGGALRQLAEHHREPSAAQLPVPPPEGLPSPAVGVVPP